MGYSVSSMVEFGLERCQDNVWLPIMLNRGYIVVTADKNMHSHQVYQDFRTKVLSYNGKVVQFFKGFACKSQSQKREWLNEFWPKAAVAIESKPAGLYILRADGTIRNDKCDV